MSNVFKNNDENRNKNLSENRKPVIIKYLCDIGIIYDLAKIISEYDYLFAGHIESTLSDTGNIAGYYFSEIFWLDDEIHIVLVNDHIINIRNRKLNQITKIISDTNISCFTVSDTKIITGSGKIIKIWDSETGVLYQQILADVHDSDLRWLKQIPNTNYLVSSYMMRHTIAIWNTRTGIRKYILKHRDNWQLHNILLASELEIITTASNHIQIWNLESDQEIVNYSELIGHTEYILNICSLSNNRIVSISCDGNFRIWNIKTKACQNIIPHGHKLNFPNITSDSRERFITSDTNGEVKIWDIIHETPKLIFVSPESKLEYLDDWYSKDNKIYILQGDARVFHWFNDGLRLWDPTTGTYDLIIDQSNDQNNNQKLGFITITPTGKLITRTRTQILVWR